jgi:hypothetical protein
VTSTLILVLVCCVMVAMVVGAFVRDLGERPRENVRLVTDHEGEEWLGIEEVAALLESRPAEVLVLVERGAIPYFHDPRHRPSDPDGLWFRRDEIDAWVIG